MLKASVREEVIARSHNGWQAGIKPKMTSAEVLQRINMFIAQVPPGGELAPPSEELLEAAAGDKQVRATCA